MAQHIQHYRDTLANYISADPTLLSGELAFETDTGKFKIGDGSTIWSSLEYFKTNDGGYNVLNYGAKGDGVTDDSTAFQNVIDLLSADGGKIIVPSGVYNLLTEPDEGTKSIYWDFFPGTSFTGAGTGANKFPSMYTNGGQVAVGPYIRSHSDEPSPQPPKGGGIAAFNIEMIQPDGYVGQSVGLYVGAEGSSTDVDANVWAINPLIDNTVDSAGTYQCIEVDVNNRSPTATVKGISISGIGDYNPNVALETVRADSSRWKIGIEMYHALIGIIIHGDKVGAYECLRMENTDETDTTNKSIINTFYGKSFNTPTTKAVSTETIIPLDSDWLNCTYTINIRASDTLQSSFQLANTGVVLGLDTVEQTHKIRQGIGETQFRRTPTQYVGIRSDATAHYITATVDGATGGATGKYLILRNENQVGLKYDFYGTEVGTILVDGSVGIKELAPDYSLDVNGTFGFTPGTSVTPVDIGDVVFEFTDNTTLTVKGKGSDGTVRSGTVTLS